MSTKRGAKHVSGEGRCERRMVPNAVLSLIDGCGEMRTGIEKVAAAFRQIVYDAIPFSLLRRRPF